MTSALSPLTQAVTGALGSASANALAYPLDLVATRLQVTKSRKHRGIHGTIAILRQTVRKYGINGVYDGLASDTASTILSNFLYFYAYSFLRNLVFRRGARTSSRKPILSVSQELLLGFIAGVASRLASAPLSILTVRIQANSEEEDGKEGEHRSHALAAVKSIYAEDGILGFWKGFETTVLLSFNPALTFAFLHFIRRLMQFRPSRNAKIVQVIPSGPVESFVTGALANTLAVTILYPLVLAKTRLQVARKYSLPTSANGTAPAQKADSSHPTMISTLRDAYFGKGGYNGGLYQGLSAQVAKCIISMGVTIMVKERIEHGLVRAVRRWKE